MTGESNPEVATPGRFFKVLSAPKQSERLNSPSCWLEMAQAKERRTVPRIPIPEVDAQTKAARWTETCRKEHKTIRLNETYSLNPKALNVLPEKVNHTVPTPRSDQVEGVGSEQNLRHCAFTIAEEVRQVLQRTLQRPTEKFSYPQTTSQELGWHDQVNYAENSS